MAQQPSDALLEVLLEISETLRSIDSSLQRLYKSIDASTEKPGKRPPTR